MVENNPENEVQPESRRRPVAQRRGGLGRGLDSLIPTGDDNRSSDLRATSEVPINAIQPNPYQPRMGMDDAKLNELADSIRTHGIVQPLVVTTGQAADTYVLIAGERRWRASQLAGLEAVPVVVKDVAPQAMLELALVENLVRADLSPLEEAAAYRQLIEEFGLTQAAVADRIGRSRVTVTNTLRLLGAPQRIQQALADGAITEGHARALLGLPTATDQIGALDLVVTREMTVRQTEAMVRKWIADGDPREIHEAHRDAEEFRVEDRFRQALGAKVLFKRGSRGGGALTIHYHSAEELDQLYDRLVGEDIW